MHDRKHRILLQLGAVQLPQVGTEPVEQVAAAHFLERLPLGVIERHVDPRDLVNEGVNQSFAVEQKAVGEEVEDQVRIALREQRDDRRQMQVQGRLAQTAGEPQCVDVAEEI